MKASWVMQVVIALGFMAGRAACQDLPAQPIATLPTAAAIPHAVLHLAGPHQETAAISSGTLTERVWHRALGWVTVTDDTLWPGGCRPKVGDGNSHGWAGRTYASGEYLLWWLKDSPVPPLVTIGSANNLQPGALGQSGTAIIVGGDITHEERSGGRFRIGHWCDDDHVLGVELDYLFLGRRTERFDVGASGSASSTVVARPYLNVVAGTQTSDLVAFPQILAGRVHTELTTSLWGIEANARTPLLHGCWYRLGGLAGVRYLEMSEGLTISSASGQVPVGNSAGVFDTFGARNRFAGVQAGLLWQMGWGRWGLDLSSKFAIGQVEETVAISGQTAFTQAAGTTVFPVGLLAQRTNSGNYSQDEFAVVPEFGVKFNCHFTDHLRGTLGYSFLYCSEMARPGNQIDTGINPSQLPSATGLGTLTGVPRPGFEFQSTSFWAQGVSFGLEVIF